jgi:hypothetical protein
MNKKERQSIFTKVYKHLDEQGECLNGSGLPRYYFHGRSCAIGCLIPKEKYKKSIENNDVSIDKVWTFLLGVIPNLADSDLSFMAALQCAHDWDYNLKGKEGWVKAMVKISNQYNLRVPK